MELRFADDIDLIEGSEDGLQEVTRVEDTSKRFGMEISAEKSKVMVVGKKENVDGQVVNVMVGGKRLEQVKNFIYLGSTLVEDEKSEKEIRIRIGRATSALVKLDNIWRSKSVEMKNKLLLMIVMATLLYACESWTVSKSDEQRRKVFEMKIYRRLLAISWKEKKTNLFVKNINREICGYEPEGVVEMVKKRKFKYFGHRVHEGGTAKAVMEGGMKDLKETGWGA